MKKLVLVLLGAFLTIAVSAQQVINKSAIYDGEIVSLKESSANLYAYSSGYDVDEQGRVTGKVLSFHENGNLQEIGTLTKGQKHGSWISYDPSGNKINQASYLNGKKHGEWKVWDSQGNLIMEFAYDNGQRKGTWKMYDADGNVTQETQY